jgi:general stress protein 26
MATEREITEKFWKSLKSDRTVMLGLAGDRSGESQPMTALLDKDAEQGPIWIFTSKSTDLAQALAQQNGSGREALLQFAAKGHDLFATLHGTLICDNDRAMIDRLWNSFIAAWFEGGKDDPQLQLLRFEPDRAHIWLNENSLFAGIKILLGRDPKKEYRDKVADVRL